MKLKVNDQIAKLYTSGEIEKLLTVTHTSKKSAFCGWGDKFSRHGLSFFLETVNGRAFPRDPKSGHPTKGYYTIPTTEQLIEYQKRIERKNLESQISSLLSITPDEHLEKIFHELKGYLPF